MFPGTNELKASLWNNLDENNSDFTGIILCVPPGNGKTLHRNVISHWPSTYRKWSLALHEIRCILLAVALLFVCCPDHIFVLSTRVMNLCQQCYQHNWYIWACHSYIPWGHRSVCNWQYCSLEWPAIAHPEPSNILTIYAEWKQHIYTLICNGYDSNIYKMIENTSLYKFVILCNLNSTVWLATNFHYR